MTSSYPVRSSHVLHAVLALGVFGLSGCINKDTITCNPGFVEQDGACVATDAGTPDAGPDVDSPDVFDAGPEPMDATPDIFDGGADAGPCGECGAERPLCNPTTMECVECLAPTDCGVGGASMCTDAGDCVECLGNADCEEPDASVCSTAGDTAGSCVACAAGSATDCAGIVDGGANALNVCDESGESPVCVQCNAGDESACEPNVCDVLTKVCTEDVLVGMTPTCGGCVSDSQCGLGQTCAPTTFDDMNAGYYCLWNLDAEEMAPDFCTDVLPFGTPDDVTSIGDVGAEVCTLRLSTCPAYNDFSSPGRGSPSCAGEENPEADADCGHPELDDGFCQPFGGLNRCTTRCTSSDDCVFGVARDEYQCNAGTGFCNFTLL